MIIDDEPTLDNQYAVSKKKDKVDVHLSTTRNKANKMMVETALLIRFREVKLKRFSPMYLDISRLKLQSLKNMSWTLKYQDVGRKE